MSNKTLLTLFAAAALFLFGYFYLLPKTGTKAPPKNTTQITAAPAASATDNTPVKPPTIATQTAATNAGGAFAPALKTFDQFTPVERDRLRLDFQAMSETERLFAVISAEDEAWKKDNFFPDKNYIENSDEATLEDLALNHADKLATNAIIYKWWLRKDARWKDLAQEAVTAGSSFAARYMKNLIHLEKHLILKRLLVYKRQLYFRATMPRTDLRCSIYRYIIVPTRVTHFLYWKISFFT